MFDYVQEAGEHRRFQEREINHEKQIKRKPREFEQKSQDWLRSSSDPSLVGAKVVIAEINAQNGEQDRIFYILSGSALIQGIDIRGGWNADTGAARYVSKITPSLY